MRGFSDIMASLEGGVQAKDDGSILPYNMSSIRTPTMGGAQAKQLEGIQSLLGKGAEQSIQSLLSNGQTPIDDNIISMFNRSIMPQLTQGAAHNNMLGASGLAGAQADAASQLAQGLASQKYSAMQDLLGKYGQFAQMSPYKYSVYEEPGTNWGDIVSLLTSLRPDEEGNWINKQNIGSLVGGGLGFLFPGLGVNTGGKLGKDIGSKF